MIYLLSLDKNFVPFLDANWQKQTASNPRRGLSNDGTTVPEAQRLTAVQKNAHLDLLLGQIANFCPVISRNSIVKHSTSLNDIWQKIRQHYGFQSSGAHFLDLASIRFQPDERPEDLFQRLMAFFEDNLLSVHGGLTHHGDAATSNEDLSPTLENTIVVLWLQLIHPGLPLLVKQKYGSELRNKTLASLKPEISQALGPLLNELCSIEDTKAMRVGNSAPSRNPSSVQGQPRRRPFLSTYVILPVWRTYPLIMQAETLINAWILVVKSANSLWSSKILLFAAYLLVMSSKALSRCPSQAVLLGRQPSWNVLTSRGHTLTLAKAPDPPRRPPTLLM